MRGLADLISAVTAAPLVWLAATLVVFAVADRLSRISRRHPLCHPVLISAPVLIGLLMATGTSYETYAADTRLLTFLLGPATLSLAVPLWSNRALVRRAAKPLAAALVAGSLTAILCAVGVAWLFGAPPNILASLAPRACTTPVAMAVAAMLGGIPALAAAVVLGSGMLGAMIATPLFNLLKVRDYRARGFAAGVAAHGFGTVRAFQVDSVAGAFAGIGMALNAILTAVVLSIAGLLS